MREYYSGEEGEGGEEKGGGLKWADREDVEAESDGSERGSTAPLWLGVPSSVWVVYLNITLLVAASIAASPVYVIYFNDRGWTSKNDIFFYGITNFLSPFCTVVLNPIFGFWQGRRPTKGISYSSLIYLFILP